MITKLVERDPADDLGMDIFYVEERFEAYDHDTAAAIEHLLHHMQALLTTGLYLHPTVARYYGRDSVIETEETILAQCHQLLDYVQRISTARSELTQAHLLDEMQARIPYLTPIAGEPRL